MSTDYIRIIVNNSPSIFCDNAKERWWHLIIFYVSDNMNVTLRYVRIRKFNYLFQLISSRNAFRLKARIQISARIARSLIEENINFIDQMEITFISINASSCTNIKVCWYLLRDGRAIKIPEAKSCVALQHVCIEYCQQICIKSERTDVQIQ